MQEALWQIDAPPPPPAVRRIRERPQSAEVERLAAELAKTRAELAAQAEELDKMTRSRDHWERQVKGLKAKLKKAETANWQLQNRPAYGFFNPSSLTPEIWRRLVQLVHPDRHNGSEAAQAATVWLNMNKPRQTVPPQ
jgi:dsDNA-specific endonuclease/ATPase MutS2